MIMTPETIKFYAINRDVVIPSKRKEDAGYDIYPYFKQDYIHIKPHESIMIPTGLKSVIPKGLYIQLKERGSTGSKGVAQRCGVIDSGYRGEWFIPITNTTNRDMFIAKDPDEIYKQFGEYNIVLPYNKAICQAVVERTYNIAIKQISSVTFNKYCKTQRGSGKLGSSGK